MSHFKIAAAKREDLGYRRLVKEISKLGEEMLAQGTYVIITSRGARFEGVFFPPSAFGDPDQYIGGDKGRMCVTGDSENTNWAYVLDVKEGAQLFFHNYNGNVPKEYPGDVYKMRNTRPNVQNPREPELMTL